MSMKRTAGVWEHSTLEDSALVLMLALADSANDEGVTAATLDTLIQRTRESQDTVHALLQDCEGSGELFVFRQPGQHNIYLVTVGNDQLDTGLEFVALLAHVPAGHVRSEYTNYQRAIAALRDD